jgi:hypothetical protein
MDSAQRMKLYNSLGASLGNARSCVKEKRLDEAIDQIEMALSVLMRLNFADSSHERTAADDREAG